VPEPLSAEEIELLKRNFRKCSDETLAAIIDFRQTRNVGAIPAVVRGIVLRYLPPAGHDALRNATEETLLSDLRIESLTMLEIILDVQDALEIEIEDSEMRAFRTLGDVEQFLRGKVESAG
jgi:acyl carrier protein